MQLQAFLFDTNVPQYGYTTANIVSAKDRLKVFQGFKFPLNFTQINQFFLEANEFGCEECGYNLNFKVTKK